MGWCCFMMKLKKVIFHISEICLINAFVLSLIGNRWKFVKGVNAKFLLFCYFIGKGVNLMRKLIRKFNRKCDLLCTA